MQPSHASSAPDAPSRRVRGGRAIWILALVGLLLGLGWWAWPPAGRPGGEPGASGAGTSRLTEDAVDPAAWERDFPRQVESYRRTVDERRTRFGGSEAFSKLEEDPTWKVLFEGYPFGVDYREERGHAYMLSDQESNERVRQFRQPGACLHCHAAVLPAYRRAGREAGVPDGPQQVDRGFEIVNALSYAEARSLVEHPVVCLDCHDPGSLRLRVTRPAFVRALRDLAASEAPLPQYPSIGAWRARGDSAGTRAPYDANALASRQEMRTFVCAQCHAEYHVGSGGSLGYPWALGITAEAAEAVYDEAGVKDWVHPRTGAPVLKAQHPEFELWSQGTHSRGGVACADCHMPASRQGRTTVTNHHVRSPLLDPAASCGGCHEADPEDLRRRAEATQEKTRGLLQRAEAAVLALVASVEEAAAGGVPETALAESRRLHRRAQWRLDYVAAENSMGFHAPQEAARLLAEAIDFARQGEVAALRALGRR